MGALDQNFENGVWFFFINASAIIPCPVEVAHIPTFDAHFSPSLSTPICNSRQLMIWGISSFVFFPPILFHVMLAGSTRAGFEKNSSVEGIGRLGGEVKRERG